MLAGDMRMSFFVLTLTLAQAASTPSPPAAREIAPNTFLLPGAMLPDRGPDGNTVVLVASAGLIAIDTGRHPWHSDGILAFARSRQRPVAAIVNTHWHLDHSSGNRRIKAAYPQAKTYTTRAVDRALAPGGFLVRNIEAARSRARDPNTPAVRREETELFIATMDAADALRPDVPVERSGAMTIAGRPLSVRVATDAVNGDLWLYDETTAVAVIGDLVTLPAPFFETACPARWQDALDEVWATAFRLAVPGHGPPMSRAEFDTYRRAFGGFRACVGSENPASACAASWTKELETLLTTEGDRREATEYASYYVDFLERMAAPVPTARRSSFVAAKTLKLYKGHLRNPHSENPVETTDALMRFLDASPESPAA
jgi:glyoxylase-like metal-dependent hydrolase (beta-lactamase superfamily II)